jgi:hypothetical protein
LRIILGATRAVLRSGLYLILISAGAAMLPYNQPRATAYTLSEAGPSVPTLTPVPRAIELAQDEDDNGPDIPPGSIAKYVAVYRDMQQNRSLTVEQAVAKEGISLSDFRKLEGQIERDDATRQQVRDELQAAAKESSPGIAQPSATK